MSILLRDRPLFPLTFCSILRLTIIILISSRIYFLFPFRVFFYPRRVHRGDRVVGTIDERFKVEEGEEEVRREKENTWKTRYSRTANRAVHYRRGASELGRLHFRGVRHSQGRLADRDHVGVKRRADPARAFGH